MVIKGLLQMTVAPGINTLVIAMIYHQTERTMMRKAWKKVWVGHMEELYANPEGMADASYTLEHWF